MSKLEKLLGSISRVLRYDKYIGLKGIGTNKSHPDYSILSPEDPGFTGTVVGGLMEGVIYAGILFPIVNSEASFAAVIPTAIIRYIGARRARAAVNDALEKASGTKLGGQEIRYHPKLDRYELEGKLYLLKYRLGLR